MFELLELLLVAEDDKLIVVSANTYVERLALLEGVALAVFLTPFAIRERVQNDLQRFEDGATR